MNPFRHQVDTALRAALVLSPTSYSWFGRRNPGLARNVRRALTPKSARGYLVFHLQMRLYADFYRHGAAMADGADVKRPPEPGRTPFVQALSSANSSHGCWEPGWQLVRVEHDHLVVVRDGLMLWISPDHWMAPAADAAAGVHGCVRFPKEFLNISPGFYLVHGDAPFAFEKSQTIVRFYWNLTPEGAAPFIGAATRLLNSAGVAFRLKVLKSPSDYTRCDAGVLYVSKADCGRLPAVLHEIHAHVAGHLKPDVPVFTKALAPGLSLAEDPGQGDSFGQHRCRLLADGIVRGYERSMKSHDQRLQGVVERFAEDGIALDTPYLNAGSIDDYEFEVRA